MFQRLAEWLEGKDDSKPRFKPLPAELLQAERAAARATQRALRDDQAAQTAKDKDSTSWSPTVEKAGEPRTEPKLAEATPGTAKPPGATWAPTVEKNAPGTGTPSPGSLFGLGGSTRPAPHDRRPRGRRTRFHGRPCKRVEPVRHGCKTTGGWAAASRTSAASR